MTLGVMFFACANVMAQGRLMGKVIDSRNNEPLEYATITVLNVKDSSLVGGATSASNGSFVLNKVPFGKYLLRVTFMGYGTYFYPQGVFLSKEHTTLSLGKIKLTPTSTTLKAAEIVAERSMVEYQLDKRVINVDKNIVSSGGSAVDILENVPSVAIDNDGNVTLRGSSNVKVLIDGRPYELMGSDLDILLEQIPATSVENVEVITNPSAKYDPEGMSGIINLKLKDKSKGALGLNGVLNLNLGSPMAFVAKDYPSKYLSALLPTAMLSANLNYSTEKFSVFFSADGGIRSYGSRGTSDVTRFNRNGDSLSHDFMNYCSQNTNRTGNVKIGGEYYFNKKNTLMLSYQTRISERVRHRATESQDWLNVGYWDYTQMDTNRNYGYNHTVTMLYTKKFDEKDRELTVDATYSYRRRESDSWQEQWYDNVNANYENYYLRETEMLNFNHNGNIRVNYVHPFAERYRLEVGYEGRLMWPNQDSRYYRTEYEDSVLNRYEDIRSTTHFLYNHQVHGIYATFGGRIIDDLSFQAGLRGEYCHITGYDVIHPETQEVDKTYWQLYPTVHLSYDINKTQSLQLSYSRRVNRPYMWKMNPYMNVQEGMQLSFGNPFLDPEYTNVFELSYNVGIKDVNIFSSLYFRQTNDMMTRYGFVWNEGSAEYYASWMPYNNEYDGYWASTWQNMNHGLNYGLECIVDWRVNDWWKLNFSINLYRSIIEGSDLLGATQREAFRGSGKINSYMNLPKDWTIQISGQYRSPYMDLQTDMLASYWADLAVKKDFWNKRATLNIRIGDFLCLIRRGHDTEDVMMHRYVRSKRLSPNVSVGFSYKINNGLKPQRRISGMEEEGGEIEL